VIRASVLALLVLVAMSGCGALAGRPLETWAQDRGLTARVKARLAAADAGTLTRIHIDTYESIVYLTGGVTSTEMKRRAEEIARGVPGVEQVVNNLHRDVATGAVQYDLVLWHVSPEDVARLAK